MAVSSYAISRVFSRGAASISSGSPHVRPLPDLPCSATEQESMSSRTFRNSRSRDGERFQGDHPKGPAEEYAIIILAHGQCSQQLPIVLPKQNSIFVFAVPLYATPALSPTSSTGPSETILDMPHIEFELYGNHFCYRAAERAGRKFKHKETIEL